MIRTNEEAIAAVADSLEPARPHYLGHEADTDHVGRPLGTHTWRFAAWGLELRIVTDTAFPYSRPVAYIGDYDPAAGLPHVEKEGRLCLTKVETSADPVESMRQVLAEALELLESHQTGAEVGDLLEDFSNYWSMRETEASPMLSLLYEEGASTGAWVATSDEIFAFSSKKAMLTWWEHRNGCAPRGRNAAHFVELDTFPHPSAFPTDSESLLRFLERYTADGVQRFLSALSQVPNSILLILTGRSPGGRRQFAPIRVMKRQPPLKAGVRRKPKLKVRAGRQVALRDILEYYDLQRLRIARLDSATTRSTSDVQTLSGKRVVIVGCGSVGSGVARMLAKAGVGGVRLVDKEIMGWENVRRHELGGSRVRYPKAEALAESIRNELPEMRYATAHRGTIQEIVASHPRFLRDADLIVACTGSLHAEAFIDELARSSVPPIKVVYGWMEGWGLAAHGVYISGRAGSLLDGFEDGVLLRAASRNETPPPPGCGNATTPFGATELAAAQAMIAELCLEVIQEPMENDVWRTWWNSNRALERSGGSWTEDFAAAKPQTSQPGIMERTWP